MKKILIVLSMFIIFALACTSDDGNNDHDPNIYAMFTNPLGVEKVRDEIINLIDDSEKTINVECYLFEDNEIKNALVNAHNRGVLVQVVCDNENYPNNYYNALTDVGIEIKHDYSENNCHNKTVIIDSTIVWAGSTNWTYSGLFDNNNNAIIIKNREVALAYLNDFGEMWSGRFQSSKRSNGVENVTVDDSSIEIYFTPQDEPEDMMLEAVEEAETTIDICIYGFSANWLADRVIDAHERGVNVQIIMDSLAMENFSTKYHEFVAAGIDVRLDPGNYAFHHKFMVIDKNSSQPVLLVSSGNYSISGMLYSDDNFLKISGGEIIDSYLGEFNKWWAETTPN